MFVRRLGTAMGRLVLALINATLILVALCLWLGLRLGSQVHAVTEDVARSLVVVAPLEQRLDGLTDEIAGLRGDLAQVRAGAAEAPAEALARMQDRMARIEAAVGAVSDQARQALSDPKALIGHGVTVAFNRLGEEARDLLACRGLTPPAAATR